jgi:hypothetical protein
MFSRVNWYRERAAEARRRAAETRDPSIKSAYETMAREWATLAEQVEWIENQRRSPPAKKNGTTDMIPCTLDSLLAQEVDWSFADELPPRDPNDNDDDKDQDEDEEDDEDEEPPVVREPDEE